MNVSVIPIAIALLLTGCATQNYEAKPLEPQALAEAWDARRLDQPELQAYMAGQGYPAGAFPIKQWGLRELTLAAFYFHPSLDAARARWKTAQAEQAVAAEKPRPGVSAQLEHHSRQDNGNSPWTYGFSLDIPVELSGKRAARADRAARLTEAARIEIAQAAWQVRSNLHSRLQSLSALLRRTDLAREEVLVREEIVQMLQKRVDAGMVSNLELSEARLQLQKSRQLLSVLENGLPGNRAALAAAIGLSIDALQEIVIDHARPAPPLPSDHSLQRAALLNRLDIRAALERYEAAEAGLRMEIAAQHPDIVLSPGYIFDQGDNLWTFGFSFLLTMLNKNEGPIAEARARREQEASQFLELQSGVLQQLEQSRAGYLSALQNLEKQDSLLQAQKQRTTLTLRQFDAGYADRLELAGTRLEEIAAKQALLESSIRVDEARHVLEDALQQPLDIAELPALPEPETPSE